MRLWSAPHPPVAFAMVLCYAPDMKVKQGTPNTAEAVLIGTRVSPEVKERFAEVARLSSRSVAGELRVLIERRIVEHDREAA